MTTEEADLVCKFTGKVEKQGDRHVVEIPESEISYGTLSAGDIVQLSVNATRRNEEQPAAESSEPTPPVSEGERITVEIEDIGDQGDGIARVDRGYVLIVPDTEPGDEVTVEVNQTNPNYGFAERVTDAAVGNDQELTF